jgi:hypothetical protein
VASGNRVVITRVPEELHYVLNLYQIRYKVNTSQAVRRLLETHPAIVELSEMLYDVLKPGEGPAS